MPDGGQDRDEPRRRRQAPMRSRSPDRCVPVGSRARSTHQSQGSRSASQNLGQTESAHLPPHPTRPSTDDGCSGRLIIPVKSQGALGLASSLPGRGVPTMRAMALEFLEHLREGERVLRKSSTSSVSAWPTTNTTLRVSSTISMRPQLVIYLIIIAFARPVSRLAFRHHVCRCSISREGPTALLRPRVRHPHPLGPQVRGSGRRSPDSPPQASSSPPPPPSREGERPPPEVPSS